MSAPEPPDLQWGIEHLQATLKTAGHDPDDLDVRFETATIDDEAVDGVVEQGFRLHTDGATVTITAPTTVGQLYGLVELAQRIRDPDCYQRGVLDAEPWTLVDAPAMAYRGYCLGLQRPVGYFEDHRAYDWPITPEHFPWFYDRACLRRVLDRLARHRANVLYLWNGHPFASVVDLTERYPEAPEVDADQLAANVDQYRWLCTEARKRGIWIVQQFYNIHMSDPLAKARGWDVLSGRAHEDVIEYSEHCIREFVRSYPAVGLMPTMGEVLVEEDAATWLNDVILPSVLAGLDDNPDPYPPIVVRAHATQLDAYLQEALDTYPVLSTMMKHNNEDYASTQPDPGNTVLARMSGSHIINLHCASNLEPFAWGSPRYIRRTVHNMRGAGANGIHVYPLRYWDWPNSARVNPQGDQLVEHAIWWSAWSRYAWNPERDEAVEDRFWERELARHFELSTPQARAVLDAKQATGPVLPQIASQFTITSGNRQANPLGLHLVPLAFANREFLPGRSYGMAQQCGYPVLGESMWVESPVSRMERMAEQCHTAIERLDAVDAAPILTDERREIAAMALIATFYEQKARAAALYFQDLYGLSVDLSEAEGLLAASVETYRELADLTDGFFEDAASLHHHRNVPADVEAGYRHWTDVLELFEAELETARTTGLRGLLDEQVADASPIDEYYEGVPVDEV